MNSLGLPGQDTRLAQLATSLAGLIGPDHDYVNLALAGKRIILQGSVPSYALKCEIEEAAKAAGFLEIENGLRVAPGVPFARGLL
jgi:hypothetical protein